MRLPPPTRAARLGCALGLLAAFALPGIVRANGAPRTAIARGAASAVSLAGRGGDMAGAGVLRPERGDLPEPQACFGPGTTHSEVEAYERGRAARAARRAQAEAAAGLAAPQYRLSGRWFTTATNSGFLSSGDPTTLTWSIVPDGTAVPGGSGEPASPSNLRAFLNDNFGPESFWLPVLASVFERWGELTGVTYVYSPADDGAAFPSSPGLLGVRGDVRLSGHPIDGTGAIIAYDWYPDIGDMVLDTADDNFSWGVPLLKNVVAHEHGHGLGLDHVCPLDQTKLMEPIATIAFDGPQHDDIRAANRAYGDDFEPNDAPASATDLGELAAQAVLVDGASIDSDTDVDLFRFTAGIGQMLSVKLTPVGKSYLEGPQLASGACSAGTPIDSSRSADLGLELLSSDGTTVIASSTGNPAGVAEQLVHVPLADGDTYYVRVRAPAATDVQLYDLSLTAAPLASLPDTIFSDGFESGDLSAWSATHDKSGDLSVDAGAALDGSFGLQIALDDRSRPWLVDRSPSGEGRYRARFRLDASGLSPNADTGTLTILRLDSAAPARALLLLDLRRRAGSLRLRARVRRNDGSAAKTTFFTLPDAPATIELDWQKASVPGAKDGALRLWVDAQSESDPPTRALAGLDNDQRSAETLRLGAIAEPSTSGSLRLDAFVSHRASFIGP